MHLQLKGKGNKNKKPSLMVPLHEPLELEEILNGTLRHGLLQEIFVLHLKVPLEDQKTIEREIVIYMIKYNLSVSKILEKASNNLV